MTPERRRRVVREVPFTLDFSEDHRVYVPLRAGKPLGVVHVRSESGEWGLVEIAWFLDLDLKIRDFRFQRCRSRAREQIGGKEFRKQLTGKSEKQLLSLLTEDRVALQPKALDVARKSKPLAVTVVRSALKAILATRYAWSGNSELVKVLAAVQRVFPKARRFEQIGGLYTRVTRTRLRKLLGGFGGEAIEPGTAVLFKAYDEKNKSCGMVFRGDWRGIRGLTRLWWKLSPEARVVKVIPEDEWPSVPVGRAFDRLRGMTVADVARSVSEPQLVAAEVLLVIDPILKPAVAASPR